MKTYIYGISKCDVEIKKDDTVAVVCIKNENVYSFIRKTVSGAVRDWMKCIMICFAFLAIGIVSNELNIPKEKLTGLNLFKVASLIIFGCRLIGLVMLVLKNEQWFGMKVACVILTDVVCAATILLHKDELLSFSLYGLYTYCGFILMLTIANECVFRIIEKIKSKFNDKTVIYIKKVLSDKQEE